MLLLNLNDLIVLQVEADKVASKLITHRDRSSERNNVTGVDKLLVGRNDHLFNYIFTVVF